jgi:hypothetical protein
MKRLPPEQQVQVLRAEAEQLRRSLYKLARHIRNTDTMPVLSWGVKSGQLLNEVRSINPRRYDREVVE